MENGRKIILLIAIVLGILMVPLIGMQLTDQVSWSLFDFVIAGLLLFFTGLLIIIFLRKVRNKKSRIALILGLLLIMLIIWAELAVGIFNSPFAGS